MKTYSQDFFAEQTKSLWYYDNFCQAYSLNRFSGDPVSYPDFYAGCFINDDGKLVILTTDDSAAVKSAIFEKTATDAVLIAKAEHSYNTLYAVYQAINKLTETAPDHEVVQNISSFCILEQENVVSVELKTLDDSKTAAFKQACGDSPVLRFSLYAETLQEETPLEDTAPKLVGDRVGPGSPVRKQDGRMGNYGLRCRNSDGTLGCLVTAYKFDDNDTVSGLNNQTLGTITRSLRNGNATRGSINVSFVKAANVQFFDYAVEDDSGKTVALLSDKLWSGSYVTGAVLNIYCYYGGKMQIKTGKIDSTEATTQDDGRWLYRMTESRYAGITSNDARGCIMSKPAGTTTYEQYACATFSNFQKNGYCYFTPLSRIGYEWDIEQW